MEFQKFLLRRALRLARIRADRVIDDKWSAIFAAEAVLEDPFCTAEDVKLAIQRLEEKKEEKACASQS